MATIGWSEDCPRCGGEDKLEAEQRNDNRRMECVYCGYFYERITARDYLYVAEERADRILGIGDPRFRRIVAIQTPSGFHEVEDKSEPETRAEAGSDPRKPAHLQSREALLDHLREGFRQDRWGWYVRSGMLRKPAERRKCFEAVNAWFASPTFLRVEAAWDDDPTRYEVPTTGPGWDCRGVAPSVSELPEDLGGTQSDSAALFAPGTKHRRVRKAGRRRRRGHPVANETGE